MKRDLLLVDDEPIFREPIAEILRNDGFHVQEASKGSDALKKIKGQNFDLLITDMLMPGMNGIELIRGVHKISPATEAIVISAYGTEATKDKLESMGAFGYLDKPVNREQLITLVKNAMKSNRLIRLGFEKREPEISFNRERILVADDDSVILELITEILSEKSYRVTSVPNGYEAFERILVNDYDLIILDINMPKMNGMETVKAIRDQDPYVYILLISGEAESGEVREALESGADKFLPKPFTGDKLLNIIKKVNFAKIKNNKEKQIEKEERKIRKGYTWYQRFLNMFKVVKIRRRIIEAIILIFGGIIIGVISAYIEFDFTAEKDPMLDRTDQLIDAIKKDWGR